VNSGSSVSNASFTTSSTVGSPLISMRRSLYISIAGTVSSWKFARRVFIDSGLSSERVISSPSHPGLSQVGSL